jgi:hypothetical protein
MTGMQDLHQIEYRHHQTMDLSPLASSMSSPESLAAWDSRIRAWVRHPHADLLSESACYQVFSNGQAALALRYWDERAASRDDGTLGRPLVSRVLIGPVNVLSPEAALASCRAGLSAEWAGPLPGEVPDGSELPMVSGAALIDLTRTMTSVLDQAAAGQAGLQAVVAAALAEPAVPLAISLHSALIQVPLRECVQCPLLWGLRRIAGPLFGQVGRGWSFSTFELPLGKTDPASLPGIVFREAQEGVKAPPSRWRREAKVRPFEEGALDDASAYGAMVEQAGWLIAEYRARGGDGLEKFIAERGGSGGTFAARMGQISEVLRKAHRTSGTSRPRSRGESPAACPSAPAPEPGSPLAVEPPVASAPPEARQDGGSELAHALPGSPRPGRAQSETPQSVTAQSGTPPPGPSRSGRSRPEASSAGETRTGPPPVGLTQTRPSETWSSAADGAPPGEERSVDSGYPEPSDRPDTRLSDTGLPVTGQAGQPGPGYTDPGYGRHQPHADPASSSRAGKTAPELSLPPRGGAPAGAWPPPGGERNPPRGRGESVSSMLRRLEWLGEDQTLFESMLDSIYRAGQISLEECARGWEVISCNNWYENISRNNAFRSEDLANIFGLVVIPALADQPPAEVIARWALEAPVPMVEGLLAAASRVGTETWNIVMGVLEPALACRWTTEHFIRDYWDDHRVVRSDAGFGRDEGNRGFLGLRRRSGRKS